MTNTVQELRRHPQRVLVRPPSFSRLYIREAGQGHRDERRDISIDQYPDRAAPLEVLRSGGGPLFVQRR
jgi:hypothetical protein